MQVSTSKSGRSAGVAKRTPPVATSRHAEGRREIDERLVVRFLVAAEMPLQLDVHGVAAEEADEAVDAARPRRSGGVERGAADERHEAGRESVELFQRERAFTFRRAHLHARDQATEIPVPVLAFAEDG